MIDFKDNKYYVTIKRNNIPVVVAVCKKKTRATLYDKVAIKNLDKFINLKQYRFLLRHLIKPFKRYKKASGKFVTQLTVSWCDEILIQYLGSFDSKEEVENAINKFVYKGEIGDQKKIKKSKQKGVKETTNNPIPKRRDVKRDYMGFVKILKALGRCICRF